MIHLVETGLLHCVTKQGWTPKTCGETGEILRKLSHHGTFNRQPALGTI